MTCKEGKKNRACLLKQFIALYLVELMILSSFAGVFTFAGNDLTTTASAEDEYDMGHVVGMWKMDENGGDTVYDETDNDNDGTRNGATWVDGRNGSGLEFDGDDDYVEVADDNDGLDLTGDFTIEAWFRLDVLDSTGMIVSKWGRGSEISYGLYVSVDNKLYFELTSDGSTRTTLTSSTILTREVFYHGTVSYSDDTLGLYLNGSKEDTDTFSSSIFTSDYPLEFGRSDSQDSPRNYFDGIIDEVVIHDKALEPSEFYGMRYGSRLKLIPAATLYHPGETVEVNACYLGNQTNITFELEYPNGTTFYSEIKQTEGKKLEADEYTVGLWYFDENGGDTAYDETDNDNDGTIYGEENWTTGVNGSALKFDEVDDYVGIPHSSNLAPTNEITLDAWFKTNDKTKTQSILSKTESGGYSLNIDNDGYLKLWLHVDGSYRVPQCSVSEIENDEWNYLAGTYDGKAVKLYLNGILKDTVSITGSIEYTWDNSLLIGAQVGEGTEPQTSGEYFNGTIDEVHISNIARTPEEIEASYRQYTNITFTLPKDAPLGTYTIRTNTTDAWNETTFQVVANPEVHIDSISPNLTHPGQNITFNGTGSYYRNITRYVWSSDRDGELHNDTTADFTTNTLTLGLHTIGFKVLTETGRWSPENVSYLNVTTKPVATIDLITPSPVLTGTTVTFYYNGTDDGTIQRYVWYSGLQDEEIYNGTDISFTRDDLIQGNHDMYFRVQDNHGFWSGNDTASLTITAKPAAEDISISPNPALVGETIGFEGRGADDGNIVRYVWTSNISGELHNDTMANFTTNTLPKGAHNITLRVQDNEGFWSRDVSELLVVHERPVAIIESISPDPALDTVAILFNATATDDGTIERCVWTSDLDGELHNDSAVNFTTTGLSVGTHNISLRALDNHGAWSEEVNDTLIVHRKPMVEEIAFTIENGTVNRDTVLLSESIFFDAMIDDDGTIESYSWRIVNETGNETYTTTAQNFTQENMELGIYKVYLMVLDNHGAWSEETNKTLVVHERPTAIIEELRPNPARDIDEICLTGRGTDDGTIERYLWKIDGEKISEGVNPVHCLPPLPEESYMISLSVRDNHGVWSDEVSEVLVVHEAPVAFIDSIYPLPGIKGKPVYFNGHGTGNGEDGEDGLEKIRRYVWSSDVDGVLYSGPHMSSNVSNLSNTTHTINLTVQDEIGLWSVPVSLKIAVNKKPEAVIALITLDESVNDTKVTNNTKIGVDDKIKFVAAALADGEITRFVWISNIDGEIYNGSSHVVFLTLSKGNHTISLLVRDEYGVWSGKAKYEVRSGENRYPISLGVVEAGDEDEDDEPMFTIPGIEDFTLPVLERLTNLCLLLLLLYLCLSGAKFRRKRRKAREGGERQ